MAPKPANVAKATDAQLLVIGLFILLRRGGIGSTISNPPADLAPYFVDAVQDAVLAEIDRRALSYVTAINAMP